MYSKNFQSQENYQQFDYIKLKKYIFKVLLLNNIYQFYII